MKSANLPAVITWTIVVALVWISQLLLIYDLNPDWIVDDAFISFRYADNLAKGDGLVYNPGEYVEGYSNFLWVIIMAGFALLGIDLWAASVVVNIVLSIICCVLLFRMSVQYSGRSPSSGFNFLAIALTGANAVVTVWVLGGLENILMMTLIILFIYLILRQSRYIWILSTAMAITLVRPEGIIFPVIYFIWLYLSDISLREFSVRLIWFSLLLGVYLIFKLIYFGDMLPNTFYAKVGYGTSQLENGLRYVINYLHEFGGILIILSLVLVLVIKKYSNWSILYLLFIGGYISFIIYSGGDIQPAYRFFTPIVPLMAFGIQETVAILYERSLRHREQSLFRYLITGFAMLLLVLWMIYPTLFSFIETHVGDYRFSVAGRDIGLYFKENADPEETIAVNTAGSIPYYAETRAIDMLGLCDAHIGKKDVDDLGTHFIGHEKYDGQYVLSRLPEYIIFGSSLGTFPIFEGDKEIFQHPVFQRNYEKKFARYGETSFEYQELKYRPSDLRHTILHQGIRDKLKGYQLIDSLDVGDYFAQKNACYQKDPAFDLRFYPFNRFKPELIDPKVKERILLDFEDYAFMDCQMEGEAFKSQPAYNYQFNQEQITGYQGEYFINTFSDNHDLKGKMVTPEFIIDRPYLSLRVGGGSNDQLVFVRLMVKGREERRATGKNNLIFERVQWDVSEFLGMKARIEIVDDQSGPWGFIMVDDIVLTHFKETDSINPRNRFWDHGNLVFDYERFRVNVKPHHDGILVCRWLVYDDVRLNMFIDDDRFMQKLLPNEHSFVEYMFEIQKEWLVTEQIEISLMLEQYGHLGSFYYWFYAKE